VDGDFYAKIVFKMAKNLQKVFCPFLDQVALKVHPCAIADDRVEKILTTTGNKSAAQGRLSKLNLAYIMTRSDNS
jgi:hypothetical protein